MQFLPVVQRELLVASRKRATYLSRALSAAILLVLFAALLLTNRSSVAFSGAHILLILSSIVFFECIIAGIRYTADCLSEEKRDGTLGLLFLTNLSGFDVVAGKMIARSLRALFNLIAVIPILALTVPVGGVSGAQITSLSFAFLAIILLSLAAGSFISSYGYAERSVLVGTLFFLIVICFVPFFISELVITIFNFLGRLYLYFDSSGPLTFVDLVRDSSHHFKNLSPWHLFQQAGLGFPPGFHPALWTQFMISFVLVARASSRIRHGFGEPEKAAPPPKFPLCRFRRHPLRLPQFARSPVLWLTLQSRTPRSRVFLFCLSAVFLGFFIRLGLENNWGWSRPLAIFGSYGFHIIYKFLIVAETCRQLNHDKRSGALELLLTTPIPALDVVSAQITATRKTWLPAGLALGIMNFAWMTESSFYREFGLLIACSFILVVADSYALAWRSVLNSVRGERYTTTVFKTYFRLMIPPIAVIAFVFAILISAGMSSDTARAAILLWTIACVIYDLLLILHARSRLLSLRSLAAGDEGLIRVPLPSRAAPISILPRPGINRAT